MILMVMSVIIIISPTHAVDLSLSLKAGLNSAMLHGENAPENAARKFSGVIGAGLGIQIAKIFSLQPELYFTNKGCNYDDYTFYLPYLEVAIPQIKLLIPAENVYPAFYIAPTFSLLLNARLKFTSGDTEHDFDVKDDFKTIDFGGAAGAEFAFDLGPGRLLIDARYTLGIPTILEPDEINGEKVDQTAKNGVISGMIGYTIEFGGE